MKDFLLSHLNDVLLALVNVQNILQQLPNWRQFFMRLFSYRR